MPPESKHSFRHPDQQTINKITASVFTGDTTGAEQLGKNISEADFLRQHDTGSSVSNSGSF
jgi:hypothetical protein